MKIAFVGKGGAGKSTLLALIHSIFSCEIYDAGPAYDLEILCPKARRFTGKDELIEPALVEFGYASLRRLRKARSFKAVLVTTPHVHAVEATKKIANTLADYPCEVLGIIVNQSNSELSEKISKILGLRLVGSVPLITRLDDHAVKESLATFDLRAETELMESVREIGRFLRLKEKIKTEKKEKGRFFLLR